MCEYLFRKWWWFSGGLNTFVSGCMWIEGHRSSWKSVEIIFKILSIIHFSLKYRLRFYPQVKLWFRSYWNQTGHHLYYWHAIVQFTNILYMVAQNNLLTTTGKIVALIKHIILRWYFTRAAVEILQWYGCLQQSYPSTSRQWVQLVYLYDTQLHYLGQRCIYMT